MQNVLVTGSSGFLGFHVLKALKAYPGQRRIFGVSRFANPNMMEFAAREQNAYSYREKQCDLSYPDEVHTLIRETQPNVIIHLAGCATIKPDQDQPFEISHQNIMATHHLLEFAPKGCRFVYASSATVYGEPPFTHTRFDESSPIRPNSVYGATKAASEALVRAYTNQGRVNGTILRYVANVGAYAKHGVLPDLIRKAKSDSPTLDLIGDPPGSTKPYVYAGDTAKATLQIAFEWKEFQGALNVSQSDELSVADLARIVLEELKIDKPIRWLGETANWVGDNRFVRVTPTGMEFLDWDRQFKTSHEAVRYAIKEMESCK